MARQEQLKEEGIRDRKALDEARNECFSIGNELNEAESSFRTIHSRREYLEKADKEYASFPEQRRQSWKTGPSSETPFMALLAN